MQRIPFNTQASLVFQKLEPKKDLRAFLKANLKKGASVLCISEELEECQVFLSKNGIVEISGYGWDSPEHTNQASEITEFCNNWVQRAMGKDYAISGTQQEIEKLWGALNSTGLSSIPKPP